VRARFSCHGVPGLVTVHRFRFQQRSNDLESWLPLYVLLKSPLLALRAVGSIAVVGALGGPVNACIWRGGCYK
jgi:hypothetical protein